MYENLCPILQSLSPGLNRNTKRHNKDSNPKPFLDQIVNICSINTFKYIFRFKSARWQSSRNIMGKRNFHSGSRKFSSLSCSIVTDSQPDNGCPLAGKPWECSQIKGIRIKPASEFPSSEAKSKLTFWRTFLRPNFNIKSLEGIVLKF